MNVIENPFGLIEEMFDHYVSRNSYCCLEDISTDFGDESFFKSRLDSVEFMRDVPSFQVESFGKIQPNTLVRYRGLVQDVCDPEFYCGAFKSKDKLVSSKYRDTIQCECEILEKNTEDFVHLERTALICIAVPGEKYWTGNEVNMGNCNNSLLNTNSPPVFKRPIEQLTSDEDDDHFVPLTDINRHKLPKLCQETKSGSISNTSYFGQIPTSSNACCLVRVYDGTSRPPPRLLDMVEFLCIYTQDPFRQETEFVFDDCDFDTGAFYGFGFAAQYYSFPSIAPRLHSVAWRKLGSSFPLIMTVDSIPCDSGLATNALQTVFKKGAPKTNTNTFYVLAQNCSGLLDSAETASMLSKNRLMETRSDVLAMLTEVLLGDSLAAEYVLLGMLSHVYGRHETSTVLGSVVIRLCGLHANDERVSSLESVLAHFLPRIAKISVNGTALNSLDLRPVKNSDTNRMSDSPLQLAAGTVLFLDETSGEGDALTSVGLRSLQTLQGIISSQILTVECGFCEVDVPTDFICILLSSAQDTPSMRFGDSSGIITIPLDTSNSDFVHSNELEVSWLTTMRLWWAVVRLIEPTMADETLRMAETDFVRARNTPHVFEDSKSTEDVPPNVDASDFHNWLNLARLVAVSFGESSITVDHWRRVQQLETQRVHRLQPLN